MGCFLSSAKETSPNSNIELQSTTTHRSPPLTLSILNEEVKEVLSETPVIINNNLINHSTDEKNIIPKKQKLSPEKKQCHDIHDSHVFKIAKIFNPKELRGSIRVGSDPKDPRKELSRNMLSISVGSEPKELSRSTPVGSDQNGTAKEVSRHIRVGSGWKETKEELSRSIRVGSDQKEAIKDVLQRSPAKYRNTSPARRPEHLPGSGQIRNISPARRPEHLSGSGQIRNTSPAKRTDHLPGSGQTLSNSPIRVGSGKNTGRLSRKDNGESSCRRSRSPVMCGDQINGGTRNSISRCTSARKSGKSPGRVRSELGDRRRSPAVEAAGNGSRSNRENRERNNNYKKSLTSGINESLENPLVSLECFIFI
ncbi:hypothetical protein HAX54_002587 [Datura stramonium]|uniref:Uncharacterized protein n=1 Tax=Datura stramonium TaxID=4076 RepID=A0ABS8T5C6_DATST|nr:hypothetical protein [Datura stramonium]